MLTRSAVRVPQFDEKFDKLVEQVPQARAIIDGAIWEIERDPKGCGTYIPEWDVWEARLVNPPVLLLYCINPRFIPMLTIVPVDSTIVL
jgi:hypothetical protein